MPVHLLDTNHMSILERESPQSQRLEARLSALPQDDVAATIISVHSVHRMIPDSALS